jgi:hypothetical protein
MADILPFGWRPRVHRSADARQADLFDGDVRYRHNMGLPDLDDDELAAVIAALKEKLARDRFPHAPRLGPVRRALAKLDSSSVPKPTPPRTPLPQATRTRGPRSRR